MALIHLDGFDTYTTSAELNQFYQVHSSGVTVAETGRFGTGYAIRIPLNRHISYNLPTPLTTVIFGFACYVTHVGRDGRDFAILGTTTNVTLLNLFWYDGRPRFVIGGSHYISSFLVSEGWHYFEVKVTGGASSTGSCYLNIDGIPAIAQTGVTITGSGDTQTGFIVLTGYDDVKFSGNLFDDFYVADTTGSVNNDFIGPCKVRYFLPASNGDTNTWTASAGSNYQCVDDAIPFNTTDYVSTTGVGNKDNYTFATVSGFDGSVKGVAVYLMAYQTDVELKTIRAIAKLGSTEVEGASQQTFNTYYQHETVFDTDPNVAAWTQANVNSSYFGIKLEA